jgi:hypothetical protein
MIRFKVPRYLMLLNHLGNYSHVSLLSSMQDPHNLDATQDAAREAPQTARIECAASPRDPRLITVQAECNASRM